MQEFLHTNNDDVQEDLERYKKMVSAEKELYFDVHQIENIFDFYLEKDMLEEADRILEIGLRQHPNATSLLLKKASTLSDKGKLKKAQEILEKLTKLEYSNPDIFLTLGWNYLKQQNIKKAVDNFEMAASTAFEEEEDILFEIGFNLSQEGFFKEALPFLEKANSKFPANENVLFELAFIYDKRGNLDKSIECYNKFLDINSFSENAWYNLGILYSKKEKFTKAVQAYEFTIAINPDHPEAHFNLGNSFAHSGLFAKALDEYLDHASLSNDTTLTYQYIADCWEQLGSYDLAIRFYALVTKKQKNNPDAWYGMGTALMGKNEFANALQALDHAISIEPLIPDYWFAHARCLFELGKKEDAVKSLENGLNIDPEETAAWIELFKLKLITEDFFSPVDYVDWLMQNFKANASVLYLASVVYLKYKEDEGNALKLLTQALKLNPEGAFLISSEFPFLNDHSSIRSELEKVIKPDELPF